MSHRYVLWASASVILAGATLLGCGGGNAMPGTGAAAPGVGGIVPTSGSGAVATSAGTSGKVTAPTASGGSGAKPTMTTSGGTGATGTTSTTGSVGTSSGAGGTTATAGTMAATGGTGPMSGAGTGAPAAPGSCGPETTLSAENLGDPKMLGPWKPTMKASSGPSGSSTLFYPEELGKGGVLHPVFHWGCGAGSQPSQYADHLTLLASHGIVVIANASGSQPGKGSLDWILAENDKAGSMFYKKLDPNRVSTGGHSQGALETFQFASDPRLALYVLVCGGSGSGTTGAANIHGPSIFLGGEGESGTTNFQADYMAITKAPSVFVTKKDTDHIYCARNNLGPWVAFMRWNLCGEEKWKAEFMPNGTYCKAPWLACMTKGVM